MVNSVDTRTLPSGNAINKRHNANYKDVCMRVHSSNAPRPIVGRKPAYTDWIVERDCKDRMLDATNRFFTKKVAPQNLAFHIIPSCAGQIILPNSPSLSTRLNQTPFPSVIRDLLLCHAIEGDAACEMMLACLGLPETEHEGASSLRPAIGLKPVLEGDRP